MRRTKIGNKIANKHYHGERLCKPVKKPIPAVSLWEIVDPVKSQTRQWRRNALDGPLDFF